MAKVLHPMRYLVWFLGATFYLYEYFLRVSPSVMVTELMGAFSVNALAIGSLSAFYFYIYAPMQLPVGLLTDRIGARKLLASSALLAGLGAFFFAVAPAYWVAACGRLLMGLGSSFGFVCLVYICSHWFPENKWGLMIGLGNTFGMIGAILGQGPLRAGINYFGWRPSIFGLMFFGFVLAGLIFWLVRNDPPVVKINTSKKKIQKPHLLHNLKIVCKNPQSWINALAALFLYVPTATFAGLWGIPFIHSTYQVSITAAGFAISMVFVGWAFGGPILGIYSDKLQKKKQLLLLSTLIALCFMSLIIYVKLPFFVLYLFLFLVGFMSSTQLLNFSYSIDVNPIEVKGTAAAFTNFIVVIGTATLQPFVGYLLDLNWTGTMDGTLRLYSPFAYTFAMSVFPLSLLISLFFISFLKKRQTS